MPKVLVTEQYLEDIADAIRSKTGELGTYKPSEMAGAIDSIETADLGTKSISANGTYSASGDNLDGYSQVTVNVPNSYSQSDEGKVVSSGALVAQTARSSEITENGTYDTTENNSVTVDVSGGGGGATILSGTSAPTAGQGDNGQEYLQYAGQVNNYIENYQNIALWTKNEAAFSQHDVVFNDGESTLTHKGGNGYERIFVPVDVQANTDYTFYIEYYPATNVPTGYGGNIAIAVTNEDQTHTGTSGSYSTLGSKVDLSRTASNTFAPYYVNFNSGNNTRIYVMIDLNIQDNSTNVLHFRRLFLVQGTFSEIPSSGIITGAFLKVSGAWQNIIGSNINDVGGVS